MRTAIQDVFAKFARTMMALRRRPEFTCGDCERSDRCGLPPSDRCIVKAAQIARATGPEKATPRRFANCERRLRSTFQNRVCNAQRPI